MRIACIHIPQFALQCATRLDPSLRGAAVAVVSGVEPGRERSGVLHAPIVLACSRAAWSLGVRLGMTATAARGLSPELTLVTAESALERESVRAVADSLLALAPVVDVGGRVGAGGAHLAMYAEVPAKTRGSSFGDRLIEMLEELGFAARIGIADDRFTAWVAAAHSGSDEHGVVSVPRGGSAAFLSPRPLSLLAITPEVQHMLEALGVRTLGEFASLPAPSVSRPLEADYQALARGESGAQLRGYTPDAPIREDVVVSAGNVLALDGSVSGTSAIALVARRLALRLAGRGRSAARIEVAAARDTAAVATEIPIALSRAVASSEELVRVLAPVLDESVIAEIQSAVSPQASATMSGYGKVIATTTTNSAAPATIPAWRLRVLVAGEALVEANGEVTEIFAEGSSPFARVVPSRAANSNDSIYARDPSELRDLADLRREARGDGRMPARASESHGDSGAHGHSSMSPLAVVLSSTGALFSLSPPSMQSERRDAHRRTRRGKQRRSRPTAPMQPRLFERSSTK